ncbi:MAG TPA: GldG family protein, partial [Deltaproteobacteria bacterium]|nr:GldG family protein [Deltaproteobacteria bacterium]
MGENRSSSRQKTFLSVTGLVILLIILILVNILVSYANIRWDATEDRVYSLSQGTKNILASIKNPVVIKFFFSRSNPNIPAGIELYAKRIRDFLSEYEHAGKNKVQVEFYDPRPDSDEEEWAERYGIEPIQPPGGEKIYCGLVLVSADHEEVIEWLDPSQEKSLEYNV